MCWGFFLLSARLAVADWIFIFRTDEVSILSSNAEQGAKVMYVELLL